MMEFMRGTLCYCGEDKLAEEDGFSCRSCKRHLHTACLKSGRPSPLEGDIFFTVICGHCCDQATEKVMRIKLQWLPVVMLALYNLQLSGTGKRGYYRWKEHICAFIDKHWLVLFGPARKKTQTWHGTVAGTLSTGCPTYFTSGTTELGESGWWKLTHNRPPQLDILNASKSGKKVQESKDTSPQQKVEGLRSRGSKTSIQAAIELRAKRDALQEGKESRRSRGELEMDYSTGHALGLCAADIQPASIETVTMASQSLDSHFMIDTSKSNASESSLDHAVVRQSMTPELLETAHSNSSAVAITQCKQEAVHDEDSLASHLDSSMHSVQSATSSFVLTADLADQSSQMSASSCPSGDQWLTERDLMAGEKVPEMLLTEDLDDDEDEDDLEIDPCALSPAESASQLTASWRSEDRLPRMEDILSSLEAKAKTRSNVAEEDEYVGPPFGMVERTFSDSEIFTRNRLLTTNADIREQSKPSYPAVTPHHETTTDSQSDAGSEARAADVSEAELDPPKRKRRKEQEEPSQAAINDSRVVPLTVYEEKQLLQKLNSMPDIVASDPQATRLRRKLIIREVTFILLTMVVLFMEKRSRGLPLFDLDDNVARARAGKPLPDLTKPYNGWSPSTPHGLPIASDDSCPRVLDRYQLAHGRHGSLTQSSSFLNRLVGIDDKQLQPIKSPYTARVLKPFIRRDNTSRPKKMLLLQEIVAYPHRNDPTWTAPPPPPIDYCYVRPEHIPPVNALCREFFWPGVDLSDCLHYPDFSCVVLYRKFVIGFAFMVPDVKYNEAYISFIFAHPEWRGAGIASFMLYHLLQTCMGKDVTLHVSASNPAMLLYQKFGFKPEEFCLDFYDKYFPAESTECRHAFFLRLQR